MDQLLWYQCISQHYSECILLSKLKPRVRDAVPAVPGRTEKSIPRTNPRPNEMVCIGANWSGERLEVGGVGGGRSEVGGDIRGGRGEVGGGRGEVGNGRGQRWEGRIQGHKDNHDRISSE